MVFVINANVERQRETVVNSKEEAVFDIIAHPSNINSYEFDVSAFGKIFGFIVTIR